MAAGFYQIRMKPYITDDLNSLEVKAIFTAGVTIYAGLYFLTENLDEEVELVLFCIMVLSNTIFITYWIYKMSEVLLLKLLKKRPSFTNNLLR